MKSIRVKLILAVSVLVIVLFSLTGVLLIKEKSKELAHDIYLHVRSLSELATPTVITKYETLLAESSFVLFQRELADTVFRKSTDIAAVSIYSYGGQILYDSIGEAERKFEGPSRTVDDPELISRIKSRLSSISLESGRLVFFKKSDDGMYTPLDINERAVTDISDLERIASIVVPFDGRFAVQYEVSYQALEARIKRMTERIAMLLIFGMLVGIGFAWYFSTQLTRPLKRLTEGATLLAKGNFSARVPVMTSDEVGVLSQTFNQMASDLEKSLEERVFKERFSKELELASKIVLAVLPKELPKIEGLDVATALVPAEQIGGDSYDVLKIDENNHLFYIGDVTGHGVPAGIVVSIANALIYSYAHSASLIDIVMNANRVLKAKTAHNMFMTLLIAQFKDHKLKYVSAGHPSMLHYQAQIQKVCQEPPGGIAVGMVPDIRSHLEEREVDMQPGDCVVLYSDGVPECVGQKGEMYEMPRFKRALAEAGELGSALAIKNALLADVKQFGQGIEQADDITLLVIRRT